MKNSSCLSMWIPCRHHALSCWYITPWHTNRILRENPHSPMLIFKLIIITYKTPLCNVKLIVAQTFPFLLNHHSSTLSIHIHQPLLSYPSWKRWALWELCFPPFPPPPPPPQQTAKQTKTLWHFLVPVPLLPMYYATTKKETPKVLLQGKLRVILFEEILPL